MGPIFYVVTDGEVCLAMDDLPMLFRTIREAQEWLESESGQISCKKFDFKDPCVKAVKLSRVGW